MRFAQPQFLWVLLVALPALAGFFHWSWRVKQKLMARFVPARLFSGLTVGVSPGRQKFRLLLLATAVTGVLLAMAEPQWGFAWEEASQRGLDIIVVVDTSRSMLAADVVPNRIEKTKRAVYDLMQKANEDRLGLVPFAGTAFLQCPLTLDEQAFRQSVEALNVGIIPEGGTALSTAIRTAQEAFDKNNNNHKVMVLFTDGEDHDVDTETMAAVKDAADAGVNIFTVGVGTAAGELLQVTDDKGNTSYVKDEDGNVVKSHLNEPLLRQIASATGGFYLPLVGADPMAVLYERGLAPLPKSESTTKLTRVYRERYHWPLTFAVVCLLLEFMLPDRARPRRGENAPVIAAPALARAAVIFWVLAATASARASSPGAYDKYQSGDYQGAFDEYSRLAGEKTNDYRLQYDAGTAAYRAQKLEAAQNELNAALQSPGIISDVDTQERAYYNLGNTLYHLGEPAPDAKEKQERWQQSIANYSKALQLNTNDMEAKNNLEFVKKKLEELQQQQQQQQNKQQNQDQNDQKDQKQQNQSKQNQDQKSQSQKDQQGQQNQQQQNNGHDQKQQSQDEKPAQEKQGQDQQGQREQAQKDQQDKSGQATPAGEDQRDKSGDQNEEMASAVPGQMTRQEAVQMLDSDKDDEQNLIFSPENRPVKTADGKIKDW